MNSLPDSVLPSFFHVPKGMISVSLASSTEESLSDCRSYTACVLKPVAMILGLALSISSVSSPSWGIRTNFILANRCLYSSFTVFSLLGTFPMRAVMKLDKL